MQLEQHLILTLRTPLKTGSVQDMVKRLKFKNNSDRRKLVDAVKGKNTAYHSSNVNSHRGKSTSLEENQN